jgi:hypothetical protein
VAVAPAVRGRSYAMQDTVPTLVRYYLISETETAHRVTTLFELLCCYTLLAVMISGNWVAEGIESGKEAVESGVR